MSITKVGLPFLYFSMKKISERFHDFWRRKMTLKSDFDIQNKKEPKA